MCSKPMIEALARGGENNKARDEKKNCAGYGYEPNLRRRRPPEERFAHEHKKIINGIQVHNPTRSRSAGWRARQPAKAA